MNRIDEKKGHAIGKASASSSGIGAEEETVGLEPSSGLLLNGRILFFFNHFRTTEIWQQKNKRSLDIDQREKRRRSKNNQEKKKWVVSFHFFFQFEHTWWHFHGISRKRALDGMVFSRHEFERAPRSKTDSDRFNRFFRSNCSLVKMLCLVIQSTSSWPATSDVPLFPHCPSIFPNRKGKNQPHDEKKRSEERRV